MAFLSFLANLLYFYSKKTAISLLSGMNCPKKSSIIDLRAIVDSIPMTDRDTVLNGIAWDPKKRRLFVTGKRWPSLFEINLIETEAQVR